MSSQTTQKTKLTKAEQFKAKLTPEQIRVYRKHFEMFDLNGDGVISARELRKVSKQMGYQLDEEQIEAIIKENDVDSNGYLSFDEFLLAMSTSLSAISDEEHRRADIRRRFAEYDRDGNGVVTLEEAHSILQKELGFGERQSIDLVRRYDLNGDGQLDYEEFVRFYTKVKTKIERVREMFNEFDKDKSGSVSVAEAKPILHKVGLSDEEIEDLVAKHDTNKDGELQYEEFVSFLWHS